MKKRHFTAYAIRFLRKRISVDANGCWNWSGAYAKHGVPQLNCSDLKGNTRRVLAGLDDGRHILAIPSCQNGRCVNPDHTIGVVSARPPSTQHIITGASGRPGVAAKMTPEILKEARELVAQGMSQPVVAAHLGISQSTISRALRAQ